MLRAWIFLAIAAVFEVAFAVNMKLAEGFTRPLPTVVVFVATVGGITFLTLAMKVLPVSVAYPTWTAVGTVGTVVFGVLSLGETMSAAKAVSIAVIIAGVAGLRASER